MAAGFPVPARAFTDTRLTVADLRVLAAFCAYADAIGSNVWAAAETLAKEAGVSRPSYFRAVKRLGELGYLTAPEPRFDGRGRQLTSVRHVVPDVPVSPPVTRPPEEVPPPVEVPDEVVALPVSKPKRASKRAQAKAKVPRVPKAKVPKAKRAPAKHAKLEPSPGETAVVGRIWGIYPKRIDPPHDFVRSRQAIVRLLRSGVPAERLEEAAEQYAQQCIERRTGPLYVQSMSRFYEPEGAWREYERPVTVHGMTREQWVRARKDVDEWDRLAYGEPDPDPDPEPFDPLAVPGLDL